MPTNQPFYSPHASRPGAVIVLVAVLLVVLIGFTVLAVDVGYLYVVRTELQRTADAAALAGVQDMGSLEVNAAMALARASAAKYAGFNQLSSGSPLTFDPATDIVFGQVRLDASGIKPIYSPGVFPPNAIQVTVQAEVSLFFGGFLGVNSSVVGATAVAAAKSRDYMIVIDCSGSMTKQSVEDDVRAALEALGIPVSSGGGGKKKKKKKKNNSAIKTALKLTYDGSDPAFAGVYAIGEMFLPPSIPILPLKPTKDAAAYSVGILEAGGYDDLVGAVAYATTVAWVEQLTTDYDRVRTKLLGATKYGGTSLHEGIRAAREELESVRARPMSDKVIVLMTDGKSDPTLAMQQAQIAADAGMYIHCVGLGTDIDYVLLEDIAALGRGIAMYVDNVSDPSVYGPALQQVFVSVATNEVGVGLVK